MIFDMTKRKSGGGGSGITFDWASSVSEITIGPNTVARANGVVNYFSDYTYDLVLLASPLSVTNQTVFVVNNGAAGARYKNGVIGIVSTMSQTYDMVLVEGSRYYVLKI